jgi:DNA mismatch repair ATPase MutS
MMFRLPLVLNTQNTIATMQGAVLIQTCATAASSIDLNTRGRLYLAMGAAGALLRYVQNEGHVALVAGSLDVHLACSPHHAHIDAASIEALELVQPRAIGSKGRRGGMSLFRQVDPMVLFLFLLGVRDDWRRSLISVGLSCRLETCCMASGKSAIYDVRISKRFRCRFLDGTSTKAGARLLRANLVQPLRDIPTLLARYDALEELKSQEELLFSLTSCLAQMPKNMDR